MIFISYVVIELADHINYFHCRLTVSFFFFRKIDIIPSLQTPSLSLAHLHTYLARIACERKHLESVNLVRCLRSQNTMCNDSLLLTNEMEEKNDQKKKQKKGRRNAKKKNLREKKESERRNFDWRILVYFKWSILVNSFSMFLSKFCVFLVKMENWKLGYHHNEIIYLKFPFRLHRPSFRPSVEKVFTRKWPASNSHAHTQTELCGTAGQAKNSKNHPIFTWSNTIGKHFHTFIFVTTNVTW